jgi:hypothetical protein
MKLDGIDNGYCRVYYNDENRNLYCLQEEMKGCFYFYFCSRDGEPSHTVEVDLSALPIPEGDSYIEREATAYLRSQQ